MEENVALDSKKQKKFVKSIRGIKKLIKKNEVKAVPQKKDEEKIKTPKPFSMRLKDGKVTKKSKRRERGLVYLSHIPHGFYEHQMTQYFKQFGVVTNVRVIRSKRTGNSKGFAFVEFREPAVGQIVAETMNNYLMGKRLIKAAYIPPEKQRRAFRKHWNSVHNPGSQLRMKIKKEFNADKDDIGEIKRAKKLLANLTKNKKKLSELGINYDFFVPVDVPEALLDQVIKQEKGDNVIVTEEDQSKKLKKGKEELKEDKKEVKKESVQDKKQPKSKKTTDDNQKVKTEQAEKQKSTEPNKKNKNEAGTAKKEQVTAKKGNAAKVNKKEKVPVKVNEKQQKEKEQKLKTAGVKPADEFIEINPDSGDESDSSCDFDSDEFDKMLENDDSDLPSDESEGSDDEPGSDDEVDSEENDESDEEEAQPKTKGIPATKILQPIQAKKQKQQQKTQIKNQEQKKPVEVKRKAPQKQVLSPKKPKFEKQNQKPLKKQFKKK